MNLNTNLLLLITFICLLLWQHYSPLRNIKYDLKRIFTILIILFLNSFSLILLKKYIYIHELKIWSFTLNSFISFFILDYSTYFWHRMNHKISFFWRFHQVHHSDRTLDTFTAMRFHLGEYLLSFFLRMLIVLIAGIPLEILIMYEFILTVCNLFHHSSIKLPKKLDRLLSYLIVTPTYHSNHHSFYLSQTDSNYSSIFTIWDKIHSTQTEIDPNITIGIPQFKPSENIIELLLMPIKVIFPWPKKWIEKK